MWPAPLSHPNVASRTTVFSEILSCKKQYAEKKRSSTEILHNFSGGTLTRGITDDKDDHHEHCKKTHRDDAPTNSGIFSTLLGELMLLILVQMSHHASTVGTHGMDGTGGESHFTPDCEPGSITSVPDRRHSTTPRC
jgi:hypothetical protein